MSFTGNRHQQRLEKSLCSISAASDIVTALLKTDALGAAADLTHFCCYAGTAVVQAAAYTQTYSTADRTVANATAAGITDSTGGTGSVTFAAITAGSSYAQADLTAIKNALSQTATTLNALIADNLQMRKLINSLINDTGATLGIGVHA